MHSLPKDNDPSFTQSVDFAVLRNNRDGKAIKKLEIQKDKTTASKKVMQ